MVTPGYKALFLIVFCSVALAGCKTTEPAESGVSAPAITTPVAELEEMMEQSDIFSKTITGFVLYDPEMDSMLYGVNETKYLTPASNTKLFTYFAGLNMLDEHAPALHYTVQGDSLIFRGTGDPSFLHPDFGTNDVYEFLKSREESLYFTDSNYHDEPLGPGWSWADYDYYYSTEKSPLPIYGNVARFTMERITQYRITEKNGQYEINPPYFGQLVDREDRESDDEPVLKRERVGNRYRYLPEADTTEIELDKPFHYTADLVVEMLSDTLGRTVMHIDEPFPEDYQVLYSGHTDTLYKRMLQPSDNFIAEQILLMISSKIGAGDSLNSYKAIDHAAKKLLDDLPDEPQWRDGSGLSRYNLFTPRSMAALLKKIDEQVDDEHLFEMLPAGGKSGTISDLYEHRDGGSPYVFAKTGTLSNNHCLSGYLLTRNGEKLIFSFMNNNYTLPTSEVQAEMEKILWYIHEHF